MSKLDDFTLAYIECMLWAETDDNGEPLEDNYSIEDISPESLERIVRDCAEFQKKNSKYLQTYNHPQYTPDELGGHDFWLTRNGHGAGFWDRYPCLSKEIGDKLTIASKEYREVSPVIGDDGLLYLE